MLRGGSFRPSQKMLEEEIAVLAKEITRTRLSWFARAVVLVEGQEGWSEWLAYIHGHATKVAGQFRVQPLACLVASARSLNAGL